MPEGGENLPPDPRPPFWTLKDYFLALDMFGVRPTLEINGKRKYKTWCGFMFSLLVIIIVVIYASYKISHALHDPLNEDSMINNLHDSTGLIYNEYNKTHKVKIQFVLDNKDSTSEGRRLLQAELSPVLSGNYTIL